MVIKTEFGFKVSSKNGSTYFISKLDAYEIMRALERDYHREDIKEYLDNENISVAEDDIESILDEYEDALSDDGSWRDILANVVDDYSFDNDEDEEEEDE